jgi:hypothetical protein
LCKHLSPNTESQECISHSTYPRGYRTLTLQRCSASCPAWSWRC